MSEKSEVEKRKSEILAILFGTLFLIVFIYSFVRLMCQIKLAYDKERINRRNRQLLILNDSINLNLI